MKNIYILASFILLTQTAFAEEQICSVSDASPLALQLADDNCDVTDKLRTCAEVPVDPDAIGKGFDRLSAFGDKEYKGIQRGYYNNQPGVMQFFHVDKDEERWAKENNKPYPRSIFDWFTNNGESDGVDKEKIKEAMKSKYVEFAKANDCTPLIKHGYVHSLYPQGLKAKTEDEVRDIISAPDYKEKKDKHFAEKNSKVYETGIYCEKDRLMNLGPWHYVEQVFPPCTGNVTGVFKDNEWNASTLDQKIATSATDEVTACIKDRLAKGAEIHHISIVSSASALNNTGEAAKRFCKKGFMELSKARAEAAQKNILPKLFSKAGQDASAFADKIELDVSGTNGDGTSGPCPYKIVDGKEVLRDEYKTAAGKKSLDDNKYIKIHVTFNSKTKAVTDQKKFFQAPYSCRQFHFECAPKSPKK